MALDIYLQPDPVMPRINDTYEHLGAFYDTEGYYWFLEPLFAELYKTTGQYIDLYGGAIFHGEALKALAEMLLTAHEQVSAQPESWEVVTSIQLDSVPGSQEIRKTVHKQGMLALLDKLEAATHRAQSTGCYINFWGD